MLKSCKFVQETSEEVLDFKAQQLVSIKVYEIHFFKTDFNPICEYMFRLSFLTTLNIYKKNFKGCKKVAQV